MVYHVLIIVSMETNMERCVKDSHSSPDGQQPRLEPKLETGGEDSLGRSLNPKLDAAPEFLWSVVMN